MTRRTKIDGAVLTLGEMAYVLNHAGLSWAIIRWVFGYTYNRSAQSTARKTAEWGGLPWINGRSPSQSQREMLTGWTRSHPEGRRVTHGRTLAEIALSLIESGLIKIVLDGGLPGLPAPDDGLLLAYRRQDHGSRSAQHGHRDRSQVRQADPGPPDDRGGRRQVRD